VGPEEILDFGDKVLVIDAAEGTRIGQRRGRERVGVSGIHAPWRAGDPTRGFPRSIEGPRSRRGRDIVPALDDEGEVSTYGWRTRASTWAKQQFDLAYSRRVHVAYCGSARGGDALTKH
jgi:hypothetical protein